MKLRLSPERARVVGHTLGAVPDLVYQAIDRGEPEWPVLTAIGRFEHPFGILTGLALGLTDFQLGPGGAAKYWAEVTELLRERGPVSSRTEIAALIDALLTRPVSARLGDLKRVRVRKFLASTLVDWLSTRSIGEVASEPMVLWNRLAGALNQPPDAKTIAFAMKVFDLMHCALAGSYVHFPSHVPIVADLRIARISISSGLLEASDSSPQQAMTSAGEWLPSVRQEVLSAWSAVSEASGWVSLFRIDSLAWQVAAPIYTMRFDRARAASDVAAMLKNYGATTAVAEDAGVALTASL